jgi:hypothetical protein
MKWLRGKKIQSHWEEIQNFKKNISTFSKQAFIRIKYWIVLVFGKK